MITVRGDAVKLAKERGGVLFHQVNLQRLAGAGIAYTIRETFPQWYVEYLRTFAQLGDATLYQVQVHPETYVASLYAQNGVGTKQRQTDYDAFETALAKIVPILPPALPLWVPYKIGCGLGGGEWQVIVHILDQYIPQAQLVHFAQTR